MGRSNAEVTRATSAADLCAAADLMRAYVRQLGVDLGFQDFEAELAGLPGKYAPPRGALLIARRGDGKAVGCAALRPLDSGGCCEMKRLYVSPEGRGLGLGRELAKAIVAEARRLGYREMRLDTLPSMKSALAIYRGLGFVETDPYYTTPLAGTIFMALDLGRDPVLSEGSPVRPSLR